MRFKAIQVLGESELRPERLFRRGKLYDVEEQTERWVTLSRANLEKYHHALSVHCDALQQFCHKHRVLCTRLSSAQPITETVTETLAQVGLVTLH